MDMSRIYGVSVLARTHVPYYNGDAKMRYLEQVHVEMPESGKPQVTNGAS